MDAENRESSEDQPITQSNVAHLGDQFFSGRLPYIHLSSGGDVEGSIRNVKRILEILPENVKIIPGHGPLASKADLRLFLDTIVDSSQLIRESMKSGKGLEEIQQAGLPDKYEEWGSGFINVNRWIQIVYNSYSRQGAV